MLRFNKPLSTIKSYANEQSAKLSDKVYENKEKAGSFFSQVASMAMFFRRIVIETFSRDFEFKEFLRQCYQIGTKSFSLVAVTGVIMGVVLAIQSRPALVQFGAVSMLPSMVAISLIREIGPVITALLCAGKIGSGIGAELGSMKVTEQIDAMEVSETNPVRFLVVTRVLAATLMIPLLVLFADAAGLTGSWIGANIKGDVKFVLFISQSFGNLNFIDFIPAIIKSVFFGAVIGFVGCYQGFNAGRGTESVGIAANAAVVMSSLLIIIIDMIAAQVTDIFS